MRSVLRSVALGAAVVAACAGGWALLLVASGALVQRGGGWSGVGVALDVLTGFVLTMAALFGTIEVFSNDDHPAEWMPGETPAVIGLIVTYPTMLLGFGAALEWGSAHAGRLVPATVAGAVLTAGLYLVAMAIRGRDVPEPEPAPEPDSLPAEDWTVGELRAALDGLPDGTELRAEVVDGVITVLAGDRFVASGPELRAVVEATQAGRGDTPQAGDLDTG